MSPAQYKSALRHLGLSHRTAALALGVTRRHSCRWASGQSPIPKSVALVLLTCIHRCIFIEQLEAEAASAATTEEERSEEEVAA